MPTLAQYEAIHAGSIDAGFIAHRATQDRDILDLARSVLGGTSPAS